MKGDLKALQRSLEIENKNFWSITVLPKPKTCTTKNNFKLNVM